MSNFTRVATVILAATLLGLVVVPITGCGGSSENEVTAPPAATTEAELKAQNDHYSSQERTE